MNQHPRRLNTWLADKRLTQLEKKIIQGHFWIRDNLNDLAISELIELPKSHIDYIDAHFALVLGIAHLNLSHFKESMTYLAEAEKTFKQLNLHYYHFISSFNLFILASNQVDLPQMKKSLDEMASIPKDECELLQIRLKRCEFIYADESGDLESAHTLLKELSKLKSLMTENDIISHLVCEFMFHVKLKDLNQARACLEEMKKHRKFHLNENFNFMKKMLDNLTDNDPIYIPRDLLKKVPVLHHQLQVIQALEASDRASALTSWMALKDMSPELYGEPFDYKGTTCLFSLGLDKYRPNANVLELTESSEGSKLQKLIKILSEAKASVPKPLLYEMLWGEHPESKDDLQRLTRLVSKARSTLGIEIQTRKGCYYLEAVPDSKLKQG